MSSQEVLSAYNTVMNPMSTHQQRAAASLFLEKLRAMPGQCREVAVELLRLPQPGKKSCSFFVIFVSLLLLLLLCCYYNQLMLLFVLLFNEKMNLLVF
jgi:hypothetical protein